MGHGQEQRHRESGTDSRKDPDRRSEHNSHESPKAKICRLEGDGEAVHEQVERVHLEETVEKTTRQDEPQAPRKSEVDEDRKQQADHRVPQRLPILESARDVPEQQCGRQNEPDVLQQ